jgi:hypothetical protein
MEGMPKTPPGFRKMRAHNLSLPPLIGKAKHVKSPIVWAINACHAVSGRTLNP